jgi:hypothetical protein
MRVIRKANVDVAHQMWHHSDMGKATDEQLAGIRAAVVRLEAAEVEIEAARTALAKEIGDALKNNVRPVDIEDEVPYKREHIRRIGRAQGAPPLRPPTATSIQKQPAGRAKSES